MAEQGIEAMWLFPTLGVLYEELLKHDTEAVRLLFRAFNRWLDEDWGCNYQNHIFAAPYISLCDVDWAFEELEWALDRRRARRLHAPGGHPDGGASPAPADARSIPSGRASTRPASPS